MGEELAVGFRFYPTEVELISFYLRNQLNGGNPTIQSLIPILDVFSFEPTQLPNLSGEKCRGDGEQWFFFVPRQEREARGGRPSRTTGTGYWKATGSSSPIFSDNRVIGVKKTMVFYTGKTPTGKKSKWKMNEYKAVDETARPTSFTIPQLKPEFSLCRIYVKSGRSRAFDRRPTNKIQRELRSNGVATSSRVNMSASPETSCSDGDKLNLPVNANVTTNTPYVSEMVDELTTNTPYISEMVDELSQPFWEWEQVDWSNVLNYF